MPIVDLQSPRFLRLALVMDAPVFIGLRHSWLQLASYSLYQVQYLRREHRSRLQQEEELQLARHRLVWLEDSCIPWEALDMPEVTRAVKAVELGFNVS